MAHNKRIKISRRTITMIGGEAVESWADLCNVYASVTSRTATSSLQAGVVQSQQRYTVCGTWSPSLARVLPGDIITLISSNGQQLQVDSVINQDQRNGEIEIGATELIPVGAVAP